MAERGMLVSGVHIVGQCTLQRPKPFSALSRGHARNYVHEDAGTALGPMPVLLPVSKIFLGGHQPIHATLTPAVIGIRRPRPLPGHSHRHVHRMKFSIARTCMAPHGRADDARKESFGACVRGAKCTGLRPGISSESCRGVAPELFLGVPLHGTVL